MWNPDEKGIGGGGGVATFLRARPQVRKASLEHRLPTLATFRPDGKGGFVRIPLAGLQLAINDAGCWFRDFAETVLGLNVNELAREVIRDVGADDPEALTEAIIDAGLAVLFRPEPAEACHVGT